MSVERSRITNAPDAFSSLSPLRRSLLHFGRVSALDETLMEESAQRVIEEMRAEISGPLNGCPNAKQVRYFRQVIKALHQVGGEHLVVPEFEEILDPPANDRLRPENEASA